MPVIKIIPVIMSGGSGTRLWPLSTAARPKQFHYLGAERTVPSYNVMGVAKAALEASTRYAARDLGAKGIRVNAISAGAMRTLSLAGIRGGKSLMGTGRDWSLLKEDTSMEGVAGCALYLLSPIGRSITGEVVHVDAGFHVVGVPDISEGGGAA